MKLLPRAEVGRYAAGLLGGASLALAWIRPSTVESAVLGWVAALCLVCCLRASAGRYLPFFLTGIVSHGIAFHWLRHTIGDFGGFSPVSALLIFLLFVCGSALQFCLVTFFYNNLPRMVDRIGMRAALAWIGGEILAVRIFPWYLGHTQLSFLPFAQGASIGGVMLLSFVMLWTTDSLVRLCRDRNPGRILILPFLAFLALLLYGTNALDSLERTAAPRQKIALVQANISTEQKGDLRYFLINTERYKTLSEQFAGRSTLVIWPETVVQDWIPADVGHVRNDYRLPSFSAPTPMLIGSLSYKIPNFRYNSAFAIHGDGTVPPPYHKQILMPFGEYTPFSKALPFLADLNSNVGEFSAGDAIAVFEYPMSTSNGTATVKVAPLICYEDIVPSLAREAVRNDAELLVNLTNDAWFGDTVAPHQHHLIASFRAIENHRTLLRSTNSGLTAVVLPTGRTSDFLAPFTEGTILAEVPLVRYKTIYTNYVGDGLWWLAALVVSTASLLSKMRKGRPARSRTEISSKVPNL